MKNINIRGKNEIQTEINNKKKKEVNERERKERREWKKGKETGKEERRE